MSTRRLLPLIGALFAPYIIWSSTYFAIAVGVAGWPPLMMAGIRFLSAGVLPLDWLLIAGHKLSTRRPLLNTVLIGVLLLVVGNDFVTLAEHQHVSSGIAAVMVVIVPLFTLRFSRFFGITIRKLKWLDIAIDLTGIVMFSSDGNLNDNPWGALLILIGSLSWAFGLVCRSRIELPTGMMAGAIEMFAAGIVLLVSSRLTGETLTHVPSWSGIATLAHLVIFGLLIVINAYMFLIHNVTPTITTSYAYVNPVVAVLLDTRFGGESLSLTEWLALTVTTFAVVLVTLGKYLSPARNEATPCKAAK